MKRSYCFLIIIILLFQANNILSQKEPKPPVEESKLKEAQFRYQELFRISDEDEEEYLKNVKGELKAHLKDIKEYNEERYYGLLRDYYFRNMTFPMMREIEKEMRNNEKAIIENEIFVESLVVKFKKAGESEKEIIRKDLQNSLTQLFDLKENLREFEVKELENRLSELKQRVKVRKDNKTTIIRRRMEEMLGDNKYLEWD